LWTIFLPAHPADGLSGGQIKLSERSARQTYRVQYKTNFTDLWSDLAAMLTAAGLCRPF